MLRMRIERAPLGPAENMVILGEYNRLSNARIPMNEFVHWVGDNPAGPAWHAILETEQSRIVGHTSVFPLRTAFGAGTVTPAKSEYSFLHEDFRKEKISGHENIGKPAFILLLDQLFRHCLSQGWGPIFASTNEKNQVFTRKVGLRPLEFPLRECLLVLKPTQASQLTPNLTDRQRRLLFWAGVPQSALWRVAAPLFRFRNGVRQAGIGTNGIFPDSSRLSFFEDAEMQRWRYLDGQYLRFDLENSGGDYVIVKQGMSDRFLRVCQWALRSKRGLSRFLPVLVRQAKKENSIGVRWAVYDGDENAQEIVNSLRQFGFLCARRIRVVMVHNADENYLQLGIWKMNDSLFTFDP